MGYYSERTGRLLGRGDCRQSPSGRHMWYSGPSGRTHCTVCGVPWPGGDSCTSSSGRHLWVTSRSGRMDCSVCAMEYPAEE